MVVEDNVNSKEREKVVTRHVKDYYGNHLQEMETAYDYYLGSLDKKFNDTYSVKSESMLDDQLANVEILILTANQVETGVLHSWICRVDNDHLVGKTITRIMKGDITYYFFRWGNYNMVNIWAGMTGSNTARGSSKTLRKVLEEHRFQMILSLGVAFGIDWEKENLGDVIVSSRVMSYSMGSKATNQEMVIKNPHIFETSPWLVERMRQKRNFFHDPKRNYKVIFGDVITGESVVDDFDFRKKIVDAVPSNNIIGGEMEGYGLFDECTEKEIPCAVIKGICDWGIGKNGLSNDPIENDSMKDSLQAYAMLNVLNACDDLFRDSHLFKGHVEHDFLKDPILGKYVRNNKLLAFIYRYQSLFYLAINLTFVLIGLYRLLQGIRYDFNATVVISVTAIVVVCTAVIASVFKKQRKIIKRVLDFLNGGKETDN